MLVERLVSQLLGGEVERVPFVHEQMIRVSLELGSDDFSRLNSVGLQPALGGGEKDSFCEEHLSGPDFKEVDVVRPVAGRGNPPVFGEDLDVGAIQLFDREGVGVVEYPFISGIDGVHGKVCLRGSELQPTAALPPVVLVYPEDFPYERTIDFREIRYHALICRPRSRIQASAGIFFGRRRFRFAKTGIAPPPEQVQGTFPAYNYPMSWFTRYSDDSSASRGFTIGPVYHAGDFGLGGESEIEPWTHFGTREAAEERVGGSGIADSVLSTVETVYDEESGEWGYELLGTDSFETYPTESDAREAGEVEALQSAEYADPPEAMLTEAWLRPPFYRMPDLGLWSLRDVIANLPDEIALAPEEKDRIWTLARSGRVGEEWDALTEMLISRGVSGFVYRNDVENRGKDSYLVVDPSAVKIISQEEWR